MSLSKASLIVALVLFVLAAIVGFGHDVAGWQWQGLTASGLAACVFAQLVP